MRFPDRPRTHGISYTHAKVDVSALMRILVLIAAWQLVGPIAASSDGVSVGGPPLSFRAAGASDTQTTLLKDAGPIDDPDDDEMQLPPGRSPRIGNPVAVALHLAPIRSETGVVHEQPGPAGLTEAPPDPPPLSLT